ncbi:MAG: DNA internalization-related competence protein ComEC/Rec2 [Ignavibacteriales bacterium]|nr:DNA internalization-related competence protein ComEC/Rec2 [Ignavibacteriales bacterium]
MLRRRPALRFVLLLGGGIILANELQIDVGENLFLLAPLTLCTFLFFLTSSRGWFTLVLAHLQIAFLGFSLATIQEADLTARRIRPGSVIEPTLVSGILEESPIHQGNTLRLVVEVDSVYEKGKGRPERKRLMVLMPRKDVPVDPSFEAGQRLELEGRVDDFPRARNPGEFDYGRLLALSEIDGVLRATRVALRSGQSGKLSLRRWFNRVRSKLGEILEFHHGAEQASFLRGVMLGDRRSIPAELKQSFIDTGTIHILAVSGAHVAIVGLILYLVFGLFRMPRIAVILMTMGGLLFYMMLTGASSSIVRATIMGCVILGGRLMERRTDVYNSICVAACIVLLWRPLQLFDVGFQLSFAAVLSIVYFYPRLSELLRRIPAEWEEIRGLTRVWQVFAVSFAAQLGTLPFSAHYFERFSVISLAANLIVVPMVGLNLMIGSLTLAASFFSNAGASVYAAVNQVLANVLLGAVRVAADVPHASVETGAFTLKAAILYYLVLFGLFNLGRPARLKPVVLCIMVILTESVFGNVAERGERVMRVTTLDVGQGDSHLFQFPNGAILLLDSGPAGPGFDAGARTIGPFLRRKGISTIDAIVMTHPHADHTGGVASLLDEFRVREVIEAEPGARSRFHSELQKIMDKKSVKRMAGVGSEISPDPSVRLYVVHPLWNKDSTHSANNRSVVLKLVYGATAALFTGDAEREAEEQMRRRFGAFLDSDLFKVGHHGSITSTTETFLDGITPEFAIISVGRQNKFGHPSNEVIERMQRRGVEIVRTDREGAAVFESDGNIWKRIHWRTRTP